MTDPRPGHVSVDIVDDVAVLTLRRPEKLNAMDREKYAEISERLREIEADDEIWAGIDTGEGQWLVITGDRGEVELRDEPYTSWKDPSELWVSDGRGTERVPVPAADAYRVMVEETSAVVEGRPGWVLPLEESRQTAAVLDAAFASGRAGGSPVRPG